MSLPALKNLNLTLLSNASMQVHPENVDSIHHGLTSTHKSARRLEMRDGGDTVPAQLVQHQRDRRYVLPREYDSKNVLPSGTIDAGYYYGTNRLV